MSASARGDHQIGNDRNSKRLRKRAWMGTIWNQDEKEMIQNIISQDTTYTIISDDDHTQDGQLHWHCLLIWNNARSMPRINTTHWEPVIDRINARSYCLEKGPNFWERGDITINDANGKDWRSFVDYCKENTGEKLIDSPYSKLYATYRGFAGEVFNTFKKLDTMNGDLENEWLWGPPGTGKTRTAWNENPILYIKPINKWWDGYKNEPAVLLDDWDPKHEVLVSHLKIWSDRYPFRCECKGTSMMARPKKIIVTSNYHPRECFQNPQDIAAIERRFKIIHFAQLGDIQ